MRRHGPTTNQMNGAIVEMTKVIPKKIKSISILEKKRKSVH